MLSQLRRELREVREAIETSAQDGLYTPAEAARDLRELEDVVACAELLAAYDHTENRTHERVATRVGQARRSIDAFPPALESLCRRLANRAAGNDMQLSLNQWGLPLTVEG